MPARSRRTGSGATSAREPSQIRKEAALSGSAWVPPGRLVCAASGPPLSTRIGSISTSREGCESGRIGTPGERVRGNLPWVRIPLPPHRHRSGTRASRLRCRHGCRERSAITGLGPFGDELRRGHRVRPRRTPHVVLALAPQPRAPQEPGGHPRANGIGRPRRSTRPAPRRSSRRGGSAPYRAAIPRSSKP